MIFTFFVALLLIILFFVISILVIPLHITFELFKSDSKVNGFFRVTWIRIKLFQRIIPSPEKPTEEKKEEKKKKEKTDFNKILNIFNDFIEALPYLNRILFQVFRSITIEYIKVRIKLGFQSSADTAVMTGYLWSLAAILKFIPKISFFVKPDFQNERLDFSFKIKFKLKLIGIVLEFIKAFMKKPVRIFIKDLRSLN
ncbi:MAG: DUF2953 domain-containing protein [Methanomicrobiales archaeon]